MRRHTTSALLATMVMVLVSVQAGAARAEGFRFWLGARGDYFSGSNDVFVQFDNDFGFGLETGLGLGGFAMAGEALIMGDGQYLFSLNLGAEFFPKESPVRIGIGIFTGPLLFLFSKAEVDTGVDFSGLTSSEVNMLLQATGFDSLSQAESEFDVFAQQKQALGRLGFGWNVVRLRLSFDVPLGPIRTGVAGQVGYHLFISGEDVAAGVQNEALNAYASEYGIPPSLTNRVRDVIGAQPVDTSKLHGFNWDANVFVRLEF